MHIQTSHICSMDYQYSYVGNPWSVKVTMSQRESGNTRCFQFYKGEWEKLSIFKGRGVTYFQTHFNIQCHSWNLCLRKLATVAVCYFLEWLTCDITCFDYEVHLYILNVFHLCCEVCREVLSQHFRLMECFHRHKKFTMKLFHGRYSRVGILTRLYTGQPGVRISAVARKFSPKCPDRPWDPFSLLLNG